MDLRQVSPGVDDWHGGRNSRPTRAQASETPDPDGHAGNATPYGPEGSRALGGEAPTHAPCGARVSGTPLPHPTLSCPGGGELILAVAVIPSQDCGLGVTNGANLIPAHTSCRDHLLQTHPSGVLRRLRPRGRGGVARPRQV